MRRVPTLLLLWTAIGTACGEPQRLNDYLPAERAASRHEDPLLGTLDDGARAPTDVDHATARGKLAELADGLRAWQAEHGELPDGLDALTPGGDMPGGRAIIPDGGWRIPVDPWGNVYEYERMAEGGFVVRSRGPDGLTDTVDDLVEAVPMAAPDLVTDK